MSVVELSDVKAFLRVTQSNDDALLQQLIDAAEDEACQFTGRTSLPRIGESCPDECDTARVDDPVSDGDTLPAAVRAAVFIMVQCEYDGQPGDREALTKAWQAKLWPFRCGLGG
jgi:hypothetical protein